MLEHVSIKNFAVVKSASVDLGPGLNIFTGETGAGKSVIIEAVSMGLGSRADSDYIRTGEDKAEITLVFSDVPSEVTDALSELGIEPDEVLILKREISPGKSLCRANGSIVPLSQMSRICRSLADIHGQYDHQYLLNKDRHMGVLDAFAGSSIAVALEETEKHYGEYVRASSELMELRRGMSDARRQKELYAYELSEIEAASVAPDEDSSLQERIELMQNSASIYEDLSSAYELIYSGDGDALSALGSALSRLEDAGRFSKDIRAAADTLSEAYYSVDDLRSSLRHLRDSVNYSQEELDESIERLELINGLKRKFGGSIESMYEYADKAREQLAVIENADERIAALEAEISAARRAYDEAADELSSKRKSAAIKLQELVTKELKDLSFEQADLLVSFEEGPVTAKGKDSIEFLISPNRGEAPRPLAKIASGGELSRIMLALKRIIGDTDGIPTMIFDEIDTGISGSAAGAVGEKLKAISEGRQVVCITHLPQIAGMGDHHYKIVKSSDDERTMSEIIELDIEGRVEEISRLLSGAQITEAARAQAKELLGIAQ